MPTTVIMPAAPGTLRAQIADWIVDIIGEVLDEVRREQTRISRAIDGPGVGSVAVFVEGLGAGATAQLCEVSKINLDEPPGHPVLCAFGSVLDHTCVLDPAGSPGTTELPKWVDAHSGQRTWTQTSTVVRKSVSNPDDIRRAVVFVFQNSAGGKSTVETPELREALLSGNPRFPCDRVSLGGAPAIISNVLSELKVPTAFYSVYHPTVLTPHFSPETHWLDAETPELTPKTARAEQRSTHPVRYGFALAYKEGDYPTDFFGGLHANRSDRHLLVLKPSVEIDDNGKVVEKRRWDSYSLNGGEKDAKELAAYEWPGASGFVYWQLKDGHLAIRHVEDAVLDDLGRRYKRVILSGPQLSDVATAGGLKATGPLRSQLERISGAGACFHLELSGEAEATTLACFRQFLAGLIPSVGINSEELRGYAEIARTDLGLTVSVDIDKLSPGERYAQALALARALDVDRLYVHGNDYDILIRRAAAEDALVDDAAGTLFAKIVVLVATILRNPPSVTSGIKLPLQLNAETVNALRKAAAPKPSGLGVPLTSFGGRKEGVEEEHWDARRLRAAVCPQSETDGYRAAFVPCVWLTESVPGFSSTGAGDITSGVSFVFSRYCKPVN